MVILGNSNKRFSGVTSTMLATLPGVAERCEVAVLGDHYLPEGVRSLRWWEFIKLCRHPQPDEQPHTFHARRNDEMIQALVARWLFRAQLRIIFTSTAQRHHSSFTRWLMSHMDGILSTCQAAASYLESAPDALIPHGVDLTEFRPSPDRPALWQSLGHGGEFGIGIFGRVRPSKGTDLLIRAAIPLLQADPRPTLLIIGECTPKFAPFQQQLQTEIDAAGLTDRIRFLGKLPFSEVKTHFQAVSLVAAMSRNEGFGLTVLEAMASGTAVIATHAGAWAEILAHTPHRLISEHTIAATHTTLQHALQADLETEGQSNRSHAEQHHSVTQEVEALCTYYHRASSSHLS